MLGEVSEGMSGSFSEGVEGFLEKLSVLYFTHCFLFLVLTTNSS